MRATTEPGQLLADVAYVEGLILQYAELRATRYQVHTLGQQVSVEVRGSYYEARAWRHAINGRILSSRVDCHGIRRQLVVGARVQVQVVEYPERSQHGRLTLPVAVVLTCGGLFAWGFTHAATRPDGALLVAVVLLAVLIGVGVVLVRHGRARADVERQYTEDQLNRLGRVRSAAHRLDRW